MVNQAEINSKLEEDFYVKCSEGSKEYNCSLRTTSQIPRGSDNSDPTGGRPIQDESVLRTPKVYGKYSVHHNSFQPGRDTYQD